MSTGDGGWDDGAAGGVAAEYELDGSAYSGDDLGGGDTVDKEGYYHFEISDVKLELDTLSSQGDEKSPGVCFHMLVLETSPKQSPIGARHFHRLYVAGAGGKPPADGSVKSALRFGLGLGLLAEKVNDDGTSVIVDKATGSTRIPSSVWMRAKGLQCIAKIKFEKGTGKFGDKYTIPFGRVYQVDDPSMADVPKNKEAMAMLGKTAPAKTAGGGPATGGAGQQAKAPPARNPADDDLSGV